MNPRPVLLAVLLSAASARSEVIEADVVVYGGTAAGVSTACTVVRSGKTVALAEFGQHIGGLTSGGLGWTDIGNKAAIGGFARSFYQRLGKHYGKPEAWTFEPSVAERELRALLSEHKVPVKFGQRLAKVKKNGARIAEITMEDGTVYRGKVFIDTTYEGDLMAEADVKFLTGREANEQFGETLNGIRGATPHHQFLVPVDPYVKKGDPKSGLLPFIMEETLGTPGAGDKSLQAYNFRLCLTKNPENKLPIEPPPGYSAKRYELLGRYFEELAAANKKVTLRNFLKIDMVTKEKTDINNQGGFSTDYIGANHRYVEADYATRAKIWQDHLHYIQGLITFLKTDARVPAEIREDMGAWGLCKDEFKNTGGWPHAMYVREARRMLSDYVMSEKVCRGEATPEDSVGLGAYNMDSHNCRRIVRDGVAHNEGDVQVGVKPYPISYRSIVPKQSECENLFVPICLSSTHIAYGSIRMEPVFMILGESSALAAAMAIDGNVPVQKVDYPALKAKLINAMQVLAWSPAARGQSRDHADEGAAGAKTTLPGVLLDEQDAERTGEWQSGNLVGEARIGASYVHDGNANKGSAKLVWKLRAPAAGEYAVVFFYVPSENRARKASLTLRGEGQDRNFIVDQTEGHGSLRLANVTLAPDSGLTLELTNAGSEGYVAADGVQLLPVK